MLQTTRMTRCGQRGHCQYTSLHCTEDPIYLFPEMQLRSLIPNSYIHVSVSDLYIPSLQFGCRKIGSPILAIYSINRLQIHECENWETEHSAGILFKK
jgi:hypothetical protein